MSHPHRPGNGIRLNGSLDRSYSRWEQDKTEQRQKGRRKQLIQPFRFIDLVPDGPIKKVRNLSKYDALKKNKHNYSKVCLVLNCLCRRLKKSSYLTVLREFSLIKALNVKTVEWHFLLYTLNIIIVARLYCFASGYRHFFYFIKLWYWSICKSNDTN